MTIADILTVVGLTLDALGIVFLFLYAPEKSSDPQSLAFFAIEDDSREMWRRNQTNRRRIALASVVMIVVGFALQAIAVIL